MTLKESLDFLSNEGYLVYINRSPVLTSKLFQELGVLDVQSSAVEAIITPTIVTGHKGLTLQEKKEFWHRFVQEADLPWRVPVATGGTYTVTQFHIVAVNKLLEITQRPGTDYKLLVESVKNYYKTVTYKTTFQKYLLSDMWKFEYDKFVESGAKGAFDGSSRFED